MKLTVHDQAEAEQYAAEVLGEDIDNYGFSAVLNARATDPETAYEAVNRSATLQIHGMGEIGQEFDEDTYVLDVTKSDYAGELEDLTRADGILSDNGLEYATDISMERSGNTPGEAVSELQNAEIRPVLVGLDPDYNSAIIYSPDQTPVFSSSVQPTSATTPAEAQEREQEVEDILRALNVR
jgi:hypothetical protein